MKKYLFLLVITFITFTLPAQVPGYLGKRFYIKYNFDFQPNIFEFDQSGYGLVDMRHTGGIEWVTTKRMTVGVSYNYMRSSVGYDASFLDTGSPYSYSYPTAKGFVRTHAIRFDTKLFRTRRGHIAPRGPFWQFGLSLIRFDSGLDVATNESKWVTPFPSGFDAAIHIGYGRQFIVAKRLVIEYGCDAGLAFGSLVRLTQANRDYYASQSGNKEQTVNGKIMNMYAFQIRLGLGFLAF